MRIALAVLTLWLSLPPLVCQAACDARVARAEMPPCHEQPAPEHERDNCRGCDGDVEYFVTSSDAGSLRGVAALAMTPDRPPALKSLEFALRGQQRAPPVGLLSPYARANPPLLV